MIDGPGVTDADIEVMACKVHERYLEHLEQHEDLNPDVPTHQPWDDLPEPDRAQNREQVRALIRDYDQLGWVLTRNADSRDVLRSVAGDLLEELARREHDRWMHRKYADGYRWGPDRVDTPGERRHPDMVAYEDLPPGAQDKDREAVRGFLEVAKAAGFSLVRAAATPEGT